MTDGYPKMRVAIFDRVEPPIPAQLPVRLRATCCYASALPKLILAVPAGLAVAIATLMLVGHAIFTPGLRAIVAERPALGLEVFAALAFCAYLVARPLRRLYHRLTVARVVAIDESTVTVHDLGRFRRQTWTVPLASYSGIAHHVRASLSGVRHELILVHPVRARSVLLSVAERVTEPEVARVAALLGLGVVPASSLYRLPISWPRLALPLWRNPAHA